MLYVLVHIAETYPAAFQEMAARAVAGDSGAGAGPYPPALAAMALSCRVAQILGLDTAGERQPALLWGQRGGIRE